MFKTTTLNLTFSTTYFLHLITPSWIFTFTPLPPSSPILTNVAKSNKHTIDCSLALASGEQCSHALALLLSLCSNQFSLSFLRLSPCLMPSTAHQDSYSVCSGHSSWITKMSLPLSHSHTLSLPPSSSPSPFSFPSHLKQS